MNEACAAGGRRPTPALRLSGAAIWSILLCGAAQAAPFCITTSNLPPQCLYVDPGDCRKRALQLHGVCSTNPDEIKLSAGYGPYCVIDATRYARCVYQDQATCTVEADRRVGSLCVNAPTNVPGANHDPLERHP